MELDEFGLPTDRKLYAKDSCNHCYGRGYITVLSVAGTALPENKKEQPCWCSDKKYMTIKIRVAALLAQAIEDGQDRDQALEHIRIQFGF